MARSHAAHGCSSLFARGAQNQMPALNVSQGSKCRRRSGVPEARWTVPALRSSRSRYMGSGAVEPQSAAERRPACRGAGEMSAANDNQKRMTTAAELAAKTGRTPRYFQNLASTGEIDWAWQPGGEGCRWMFDLHGFENWLEAGRANKWLKTSTNAAKSGGRKNPQRHAAPVQP